MEFQCPHCQLSMTAENQYAGKVVACPGCNEKFIIPALPATQEAATGTNSPQASASQGQRGGWHEEDHANVNFLVSLGYGVLFTGVFLGAMFPFAGKYFSDIFLQRGWVNYAEVFLFVWGLVILVMKWKKPNANAARCCLILFPLNSVTKSIPVRLVVSSITYTNFHTVCAIV